MGNVAGKELYAAYREQIKNSQASLFVATNAGVVHAFSADQGKELAAFMPRRSMTKLLDQANINAGFSYTLDGPLSRHDIFSGSQWNQMVVGTGGRGEKLIYGLRSPLRANGDRTPDVNDYLWEVGPDNIDSPSMVTGYMTNPVRSGQTDSGHWVAVVNSGHYNGQAGGAKAGLVVLNAVTGALVRSIPLPATYSAGRGLGGVTLERDARRRIVAAYAGDANGNLWRFDLRGNPSSWKVAYGKPLFTTANNRPIYAAPAWQAHPNGGNLVVVATGIVLEDADLADTAFSERIYGVWDPTSRAGVEKTGFNTIQSHMLLEQTKIKIEKSFDGTDGYSITRNPIDWNRHNGWFLTLSVAPGERTIDQVRGLGSSIEINTVTLDSSASNEAESCTPTDLPTNAVYVLNALDGAGKPAFDIDGDGVVDNVAMAVRKAGGLSRNVSVTNFWADDSGIMESHGEGNASSTSCKAANFAITGLQNGALIGETSCASNSPGTPNPWSRQQYQLMRPPL
jgi:type IV pilus assembly protein PilY1